jgi:hypothetical protein
MVNAIADMAVEVAVGALGEAEWPVDVKRASHEINAFYAFKI